MRLATRFLGLIAGALIAGGVLGCDSGPPKGTAKGIVTYKGQPVAEGEVHIYLKGVGVGAIAPLDASGRFSFDTPIVAGNYVACVMPPPIVPDPQAKAPPAAKKHPDIPRKARDIETSGLTLTIKPGGNEVALELKD